MNVNSIGVSNNFNSRPVFKGDEKTDKKVESFADKFDNMSPLASGATSAVVWFGIGMIMDRLMGMIFKSLKQPVTKTTLAINGGFALIMGVLSYIGAKKKDND